MGNLNYYKLSKSRKFDRFMQKPNGVEDCKEYFRKFCVQRSYFKI